MVEKVLFPTDFSEHSKKCIGYLKKIADCGLKQLYILNVADYSIINESNVIFEEMLEDEQIIRNFQKIAEENFQELIKEFDGYNIKIKTIFKVGTPFSEIIKTADELDVDLIVLGFRGYGVVEELLLGSTAEKVVRNTKKPVLMIK
jgi:nucleotide-binding universal stress UspA family protein